MSIFITTDTLWWERCPQCKGEPQRFVEGYCDECGSGGEVATDLTELVTLAHNLAIAAGLCRAFSQGAVYMARSVLRPDADVAFTPGCGRGAP